MYYKLKVKNNFIIFKFKYFLIYKFLLSILFQQSSKSINYTTKLFPFLFLEHL